MKDRTITIRLSPDEYEIVYNISKEKRIDISQVIRKLINSAENNKKKIKEDMDYHKELYERKKERLEELEKTEKQKKSKKDDLVSKAKEHIEKIRRGEM